MSKADEVLDVLRTAKRPMTASEIAPLCASLRDSLDACWVLQNLERRELIARSGTRRVGPGAPRVCYVITEHGREHSPDGTPSKSVAPPPPPADAVDLSHYLPKPAQAPSLSAGTVDPEPEPTRDENAPPPGEIGADEDLQISIDNAGWLQVGHYHFTPRQTAQLGEFLASVCPVWAPHCEGHRDAQ